MVPTGTTKFILLIYSIFLFKFSFANNCSASLQELVEGVNYFPHPVALQIGYPVCGTSCFISTLIRHGLLQPTDYSEIIRITQQLGAGGLSQDVMIQAFKNWGLNSGHFTPRHIKDLNYWAQTGSTLILTWRPDYGGGRVHYSVFEGLANGQLYYMDPNFGHRRIPAHDFLQGWAGDVIWAQPTK